MNFDSAEIKILLEEYKNLDYDTIFKFDSIVEKYGDYAKFVSANKVNLGFSTIDDEIKGIRPGEVCYIISPTNVGKTAISMNILMHNIKGDTIIPFFSLENNEYQIFERMVQLELNVSSFDVENNFKNNNQSFFDECKAVADKWSNVINIVKRVSLTDIIPYIKVCEKLTGKRTRFVLIDYAQLIKCTGKEYEKVSEIAQQLKEISLNLRIPLIVLSQVSRQEARNENGLTLYSAKGSGEIENSAQILFSLERLKEIGEELLDNTTLARNAKGQCAILKLKTLKKKRGKDLKEILIVMNYPSLRMIEYNAYTQSGITFNEENPF